MWYAFLKRIVNPGSSSFRQTLTNPSEERIDVVFGYIFRNSSLKSRYGVGKLAQGPQVDHKTLGFKPRTFHLAVKILN